MQQKSLDSRLSLAFDLYDSCGLAADIGTDHAHLPAALLQRGRCQHMILTDISESALNNARNEMIRLRLTERVSLRQGDGLSPVTEKCEMISIMGMGGRTIRDILISGRKNLQSASLILSAHTDWHLIREAIRQIGYHIDREEPCFAAGRYYLVIRARSGAVSMTDREIRLGGPLFRSESPVLKHFLERRVQVMQDHLRGLLSASITDKPEIQLLRDDIDFCVSYISSLD